MFSLPLTTDAELRPLEPWLAGEFLANLDRSRDHIRPWVSASFVAGDLAEAKTVLQRYADMRAQDSGGIWGIWLEGRLVGGVMFVAFSTATGVCEAGCWLEPGAQGRGLITRAVECIIDWAVRDRGMHRVEWHTNADNVRSIAVAKRLGMTCDGTLRQIYPGGAGRIDIQVWSVLAPEWLARDTSTSADRIEIDRLAAAFFGLFTNAGGARPDVEAVHDLFIPAGVIVKGGPGQEVYDLDGFARPRQRLLTSGELTDFAEEETWSRTDVFGDVAHRLCRYRKQGKQLGEPFTGSGTKSMQFLRTPLGWRITAVSWEDDER